MRPYPKSMIGFEGHGMIPKRVITLPLTLKVKPQALMAMIEFVVIDAPSTYNVILGQPSQNVLRIIELSPYLKVKFPTPNGIGELKGERLTIRECYNTSPMEKPKGEALTMENLDARNELKEARAEPAENLTKVRLRDEEPNKVI